MIISICSAHVSQNSSFCLRIRSVQVNGESGSKDLKHITNTQTHTTIMKKMKRSVAKNIIRSREKLIFKVFLIHMFLGVGKNQGVNNGIFFHYISCWLFQTLWDQLKPPD